MPYYLRAALNLAGVFRVYDDFCKIYNAASPPARKVLRQAAPFCLPIYSATVRYSFQRWRRLCRAPFHDARAMTMVSLYRSFLRRAPLLRTFRPSGRGMYFIGA